MSTKRRALHFVLKIGNLKKSIEFFRDKLKMTVLRHELFSEGCDAACNGPYDGKWSKTMIGYGPEDSHFVLELTYNYSIGRYERGNDLQYIKLSVKEDIYQSLMKDNNLVDQKILNLCSPDGYKFLVEQTCSDNVKQDVTEVCLSCKNLDESKRYWIDLLKMKQVDTETENEILLNYDTTKQANLRLKCIEDPIDHKAAYGRIAFSCPSHELKPIQKNIEEAKQKVLTPYLSLDTPGKASVQVVILADPDGHEICFVGDEGFRELSQIDPEADKLIDKSIAEDDSDEWYTKKNKLKRQKSD